MVQRANYFADQDVESGKRRKEDVVKIQFDGCEEYAEFERKKRERYVEELNLT